jgi:streptomycin 6-kinase
MRRLKPNCRDSHEDASVVLDIRDGRMKRLAACWSPMRSSDRPFVLPRNLVEAAKQDGREAWLGTLPTTVATLVERWSLTVGAPFQPGGQTAWVAPVRDATGNEMVMKVGWRHPESLHEAEGLRAWAGQGAVRLYAIEELGDTAALLLEVSRPGSALASRPEEEQDLVVSDLLRRLWSVPTPGHPFRSLQVMCDQWADEFEMKVAGGRGSLDPGLVREGIALFRSLPSTADREVLLCTDLHAENVLAAEGEPWLLIDPKPYIGDPTYDPLQHLLNCEERLRADARGLASRLADLLDLDRDRLVLWLFARCVQESPDWPLLSEIALQLAPR